MSAWGPEVVAAGIAQVETSLQNTYPDVRVLTAEELQRYATRKPICGWRLPPAMHMPEVDVLLLQDFPYSLPRIALTAINNDVPHSEHDGVLCLEQDGVTFDHTRPADVVAHELARAAEFYGEILAGAHQEDFTRDFERYWSHYAVRSEVSVTSLLEGNPTAQVVRAGSVGNKAVIADGIERAQLWLRNLLGGSVTVERKPAVLCPVAVAPRPSQYPKDGASLFAYLTAECPDGAQILRQVILPWPREVFVVLSVPRDPKPPGLAAIRLSVALTRSQGKRRSQALHGQQRGDLVLQWLSVARAERLVMRRAEAPWVHGRYTDPQWTRLRGKSVAIIGAGSLGARVAQILAQSGIGQLALIDPDQFELANASRHLLGEWYAGRNKAEAMALLLRSSLPHHDGIVSHPSSWWDVFRSKPEVLTKADLILSLTGDWNADAALSDLQHSEIELPPVIYGWVEPYVGAAHAVFLKGLGPCLRCHFSASGVIDRRVTDWPADVETVPMCGAIHTPFGSASLGFAQSMVASMAIDSLLSDLEAGEWRVWSSSAADVTGNGGTLNPHWAATFGDLPAEPQIRRLVWRQSAVCPACREPAGA